MMEEPPALPSPALCPPQTALLAGLAERLESLPPNATLETRFAVLDAIFHNLARPLLESTPGHPAPALDRKTVENALRVQRLCLRLYPLINKEKHQRKRKNANPN